MCLTLRENLVNLRIRKLKRKLLLIKKMLLIYLPIAFKSFIFYLLRQLEGNCNCRFVVLVALRKVGLPSEFWLRIGDCTTNRFK